MLEVGAFGPSVKLSVQEAERIVAIYRQKYYCIKEVWNTLKNLIPVLYEGSSPVEFQSLVFEPGGTVLMPNGLRLHYPQLGYEVGDWGTAEFIYQPYDSKTRTFKTKKLYGGALLENVIQSRCRIMNTSAALRLSRYYRVALLVHDEIVMIVPERKAEACLRDSIEIMSEPPDWNPKIPLAAEGTISDHYVKG